MTETSKAPRSATTDRKTKETEIRMTLDLDGSGRYEVDTGIPFFDHMLSSLSRHALFDLELVAKGDVEVDAHHTVEDVGIVFGQTFREALGTAEGIRRYASVVLPMAESKVEVAVDISNRPYMVYEVELENTRIGDFDATLAEDFLQGRFRFGPLPEVLAQLQSLTEQGATDQVIKMLKELVPTYMPSSLYQPLQSKH